MKRQILTVLILTLALSGLGACSTETETSLESGDKAGVTQVPTALPNPSQLPPGNPSNPAPNSNPNPNPNPTPPILIPPGNPSPNSNPNPNPNPGILVSDRGALDISINAHEIPQVSGVFSSSLTSFDEQVPLTGLYQAPANPNDPDLLAGIRPELFDGTMHFVKTNSLLASAAENYLEINFNVLYPHRFRDNAQSGMWEDFFPTDWVAFHLWACPPNELCLALPVSIPSQQGSPLFPCQPTPGNPTLCEQNFHAHISGSQLPGGGVEHNIRYEISVEGTEAAKHHFPNGHLDFCTQDSDCSAAHPFCEAGYGVCTAIRGMEVYEVMTPSDLRAAAH